MPNLDLDVDHPDKVAAILRAAAQSYHESATECESNWQDKGAGRPWTEAARILERAADQLARKVGDHAAPVHDNATGDKYGSLCCWGRPGACKELATRDGRCSKHLPEE